MLGKTTVIMLACAMLSGLIIATLFWFLMDDGGLRSDLTSMQTFCR